MLAASAEYGDVRLRGRPVPWATLLSASVHGALVLALLSFQAVHKAEEDAPSLPVEIVMEVPLPAASQPMAESAAPVPVAAQSSPAKAASASHPAPATRPRVRPVVRRIAVPPAPSPMTDASPFLPPEGRAATEAAEVRTPVAPVHQAASVPAPIVQAVDVGAYVGRLHERIARYRIYPPQALRRREEGDVRLRIRLADDGRLLEILDLAEASAILARAAHEAIESAAPFDPPPHAPGGGQALAFDVTVAFRLR